MTIFWPPKNIAIRQPIPNLPRQIDSWPKKCGQPGCMDQESSGSLQISSKSRLLLTNSRRLDLKKAAHNLVESGGFEHAESRGCTLYVFFWDGQVPGCCTHLGCCNSLPARPAPEDPCRSCAKVHASHLPRETVWESRWEGDPPSQGIHVRSMDCHGLIVIHHLLSSYSRNPCIKPSNHETSGRRLDFFPS